MNKKADILQDHLLTIIILGAVLIVLIIIYITFNDAFRSKLFSLFDFFP